MRMLKIRPKLLAQVEETTGQPFALQIFFVFLPWLAGVGLHRIFANPISSLEEFTELRFSFYFSFLLIINNSFLFFFCFFLFWCWIFYLESESWMMKSDECFYSFLVASCCMSVAFPFFFFFFFFLFISDLVGGCMKSYEISKNVFWWKLMQFQWYLCFLDSDWSLIWF